MECGKIREHEDYRREEINQLRHSGKTFREIAQLMDLTVSRVWQICHGVGSVGKYQTRNTNNGSRVWLWRQRTRSKRWRT